MDLRYPALLVAGIIAIAAAAGAWVFYQRKITVRFEDGLRAANTSIVRRLPLYRRLRILSAAAVVLFALSTAGALICTLIAASRPYTSESLRTGVKKRDIMLCLDISTSVYEQNYDIVDYLEEIVRGLDGDRFGISIFNTTAVQFVPMTDNYDYVIDKLEELKTFFQVQKNYMEKFGDYYYIDQIPDDELPLFYQYQDEMDYIASGTEVNNSGKGSSLIGEGLAAALYGFPRLEDTERTRMILLSTDNDEIARKTPVVSLPGAADLCADYDVRVYGIYPGADRFSYYYSNLANEEVYRESTEKTGGIFYETTQDIPVADIIRDIEAVEAKSVESVVLTRRNEHPELSFLPLVIFLSISLLTGAIVKK